jgi:hypothetical protein
MSEHHGSPPPAADRSRLPIRRSPLLRQISGMAIGAGLVVALFAANGWFLKRAGNQLGQDFSQQKTGGQHEPHTCDTARYPVCP